jgi:hypothetical protein
VYTIADGTLYSESTIEVLPESLPPTLGVVYHENVPTRRRWNTTTLAFYDPGPDYRTELTRLEMTRRFTFTENVTLKLLQDDAQVPAQARATLKVLEDMRQQAEYVDLTDPDTIAGVEFAVGLLVNAGVILPENASTRTAEILAAIAME